MVSKRPIKCKPVQGQLDLFRYTEQQKQFAEEDVAKRQEEERLIREEIERRQEEERIKRLYAFKQRRESIKKRMDDIDVAVDYLNTKYKISANTESITSLEQQADINRISDPSYANECREDINKISLEQNNLISRLEYYTQEINERRATWVVNAVKSLLQNKQISEAVRNPITREIEIVKFFRFIYITGRTNVVFIQNLPNGQKPAFLKLFKYLTLTD